MQCKYRNKERKKTNNPRSFCPSFTFLHKIPVNVMHVGKKDMGKSIRVRSLSKAFIRPYPSRWMGARHASSAKGISSTYVLRLINICSTSHQHMFYVPSTYVLRLINICSTVINISSTSHLRLINVSSTSHQRLIDVTSTSHLRGIDVSSTRDRRLIYEGSTSHLRGTLKRNESICSV